jgi:NADH:ubiquinone oxidoreductase subunit K
MIAIGLTHYLMLSAALFGLGLYGFLTKRNLIAILMSIELMLNAVNLNLVAFSRYTDADAVAGQVFAMFIIAVAAAEVAVGLALAYSIHRGRRTLHVDDLNWLKW